MIRRAFAARPEGRPILGWVGVAVGLAVLAGAFFILPGQLVSKSSFPVGPSRRDSAHAHAVLSANDERLTRENDVRTTAVQALGGAVLLVGLLFSYRTFRLTRDRQVTDRFSTAIGQLGSDRLPESLGGIYALERVARVSKYDHGVVVETLVAFLRALVPAGGGPAQDEVRVKAQTIVTVLGRRRREFDVPNRPLRLYKLDLSGLTFDDGDFSGANFRDSKMISTTLIRAHLDGAHFDGADLERAVLAGAHCKDAKFDGAHLDNAEIATAEHLNPVNAHCGPGIGPHG